MKRFKQARNYPAGFLPAHVEHCRQLLAAMPCPVKLQWNEREVFAAFDGWWLCSEFVPLARSQGSSEVFSHYAARLRVYGQFGQPIPAGWLFAMNYAEQKARALLRLIRVLHLLNHVGRHGAGVGLRIDLAVGVDPEPNICLAHHECIADFTAGLLAALQMPPSQLHLLLFVERQAIAVGRSLLAACRASQHPVALGGFGTGAHDLLALWALEPDALVLAPSYSRLAVLYPSVRQQLLALLPALVAQGFALGVDEVSCGQMHALARALQASLLSGPLIGERLALAASSPEMVANS